MTMTLSKIFKGASLAVAVLVTASAAQAGGKLRVGTEGAYPPMNFVDSKGRLQGFDVDIANAICEKLGVECVFVKQDWDGIIPALIKGKYDAIVASMSITEERKKAVDFSERYCTNKLWFVGKKGVAMGTSAEALKGKVIGAQRATISSDWLEKNRPDVKIKLYDTQENAYLDLVAGRLDGILADILTTDPWLKSDAGKGFEFKGEPVFEGDRYGIAVRKGDDELRKKLNKAIKDIVNDGTYAKINAKYFPFSVY